MPMDSRSQEVLINFGATLATVSVMSLGGNSYRLEETPLLIFDLEDPLWRGDVIDLEQSQDGDLRFRRVISRSGWRHVEWMLGLGIIGRDPANRSVGESSALKAFKGRIEAAGGIWEQAMGGVFLIHLPEEANFDEADVWAECLR
jgi:hypothetical protein